MTGWNPQVFPIALESLWAILFCGVPHFSSRNTTNLVPRAFSSFKMAVEETPGQGCQNGSKNSLEFCHVNTLKCLRFVWTTVSDCKKKKQGRQTLKPTFEKAISSYVTRQNTPRFLEYFSTLGQGFLWPPFWTRRRPWGRGWNTSKFGFGTLSSYSV